MKPTFKQFLTEEHDFKELLKRKKPLTDLEYETVTRANAVLQDARGNMVPAIWKSVDQTGKDVFVTNKGRNYRLSPTLNGAIDIFHKVISRI